MIYPVKKTLSLWNPKMLSHIHLCTQRHLNYFGFSIFWLTAYLIKVIPETHRTWWRSFQKRIVPDEGYSRNVTWWRLFQKRYPMKVMPETLPDEGYSRNVTWWRLFQKCVVCTEFDIYFGFFLIVFWNSLVLYFV
jgi:hypothetical protein